MTASAYPHRAALWAYALLIASVFLLLRGYQFNTADQAEHLPQVYAQLDATLFKGDYFVAAAMEGFTVRHFYEKLALVLANTIGLEWGAFVLTLLCIAAMVWSMSQVAWHFFGNRWAALSAPVLVLIVFYGFTVGGNHIMYNLLISSTLAKAMAAVSLVQVLGGRWLISGLLLGMASLFQVLVGLQLMLVLTVVIPFVAREERVRSVLSAWLGYLPVALFVLVPVFAQQFIDPFEYDRELYYDILYRFRNYHHYLPSLFPVGHYAKFIALLGIGLMVHRFLGPDDRRLYPALVVSVLFGMVVYTVALEGLGINAIGKLQWFKTSIWAAGLSAVMIAGVLGMLLQSLLPAEKIGTRVLLGGSMLLSISILVIITNSAWLPSRFDGRYMVGNRSLTDLERMHAWIEKNTDKDALFLVPPDNTSFACQAKRPMAVHFHAIVHTPRFMLPWYEDINEFYGVNINDIANKNARTLATERYCGLPSSQKLNFRLFNLSQCDGTEPPGEVVHRSGAHLLVRMPEDRY